jgi:hypothetical protein
MRIGIISQIHKKKFTLMHCFDIIGQAPKWACFNNWKDFIITDSNTKRKGNIIQ